jgi:hypothetical protein
MAIHINIPDLKKNIKAIHKEAERHRLRVSIWIQKNPSTPCPSEHKESGTTRDGLLLEGVAGILEDVIIQLENGTAEVEFIANTKRK